MNYLNERYSDLNNISLFILLNIISKGQIRFIENQIQDFDINPADLPFLLYISKHENVKQKDIANHFYVSEANIARSLKKLEKNGFVKRQIDEKNKRRRLISLTDKGKEISSSLINLLKDWENFIYQNTDDEDINKFREVLYELANQSLRIYE